MATSLNEKMQALETRRRRKIEARATELIAEEMTLRDLRKALDKTQVKMAKTLGIKQEGISRIENRSDLLLSTLRGYVKAMGGKLRLVAEFPDRPPVTLSSVAELGTRTTTGKTAGQRSKDKLRV